MTHCLEMLFLHDGIQKKKKKTVNDTDLQRKQELTKLAPPLSISDWFTALELSLMSSTACKIL